MEPIAFEIGQDPLYRDVPLQHRTSLPVLGIPVSYASNAPAVIQIAERAFGGWRVLEDAPDLVDETGMKVTIVVQPGDEGTDDDHALIYHRVVGGNRLLLGSPGSIACADPERREAVAFVTAPLVADRQHFRYAVLEALTLTLLCHHDRQPLHAAALARDDAGLVLAGPSGVGKSTLVYAAARAGLRVLAEDTVHLQASPHLRIWGLPGYVHLPPETRDRFAELRSVEPTMRANGKIKIAIDLRSLGALPPLPVVSRATVCILSRSGGPARLSPLDPETAERSLTGARETGFDLFHDTIRTPVRELVAGGAWSLELSDDPDEALPLLERLLEGLRSTA